MSKVILVLGAHRSGTSAIAGMLHEGGIFMGDDLLGSGLGNPKGHFEDTFIVQVNERILTYTGYNWLNLPEEYLRFEMPLPLINRARQTIAEYSTRYDVWGNKDPRMPVTFTAWHPIFKEFDTDFKILWIHRDAESVAQSLHKRQSFIPLEVGREMQERTTLFIEKTLDTLSLDYLRFEYDDLIEDPKVVKDKVEKYCGVSLGGAEKMIETDLRHFKRGDTIGGP